MDTVEVSPEQLVYDQAMKKVGGPGNGGMTHAEGGAGLEVRVQAAYTRLVNTGQAWQLKRKYRTGMRRKQVR